MSTTCRSAPASFSLVYARGGNPFSSNLTLNNFNINYGVGSGSSNLEVELLWNGCGNYSSQPPALPAIGRAMTFTCNSLVFGGIVNAVSYNESASGFIFSLSIIDPKRILENVTIMYKGYYCDIIPQMANFINLMPYLEPGVAVCPPGEDTQNWPRVGNCGAFGTSGLPGSSPQNGVQTLKIVQNLNGRTIYTTSGEPLTLDLGAVTGLVATRAQWSRMTGESASVLQIIEKACEDIACGYFIELVGTTVRVFVIDRSIEPNPGVISAIIRAGASTGTLISGEEGLQEIYEESNKIIIGENVHYVAEVTRPITMTFGTDSRGNVQRVKSNNFSVVVDIRALRQVLEIPLPDDWKVSEEEMICSKTLQMWLLYGLCVNPNSLSRKIIEALNLGQDVTDKVLKAYNVLKGGGTVTEWKRSKIDLEGIPKLLANKVNYTKYTLAHGWFRSFIEQWYGKKYLVPVNNFCAYPSSRQGIIRSDAGQFYLSDVPSDAGGYPSPSQISGGIRGLIPGEDTTIFETSDNKINSFVEIDINQNLTKKIAGRDIRFWIAPQEMNASSFYIKNNKVYVKATADGTVIRNAETGFPEVLLTLDSKISAVPYFGNERQYLLNRGLRAFTALFGEEKYDELKNKEKGYSDVSSFNIFDMDSGGGGVNAAAIAMRSNVYVYGPWTGSKGAIGSTRVEIKGDLSPWNYGGWSNLNTVGRALANNGLRSSNTETNTSFTLAEPPGYNVHYFLSAGIYVESINLTYDGTSGVTTKYSFRTYTSKFGDYGAVLSELVSERNRLSSEVFERIRNERKARINQTYTVLGILITAVVKGAGVELAAQNIPSPGFIIIGGYADSREQKESGEGGS